MPSIATHPQRDIVDCPQELESRPPSPLDECAPLPHALMPITRPRPIPNSYWATPYLLACEYPWTPHLKSSSGSPSPSPNSRKTKKVVQKIDALLNAGVRTFIDLTECGELASYWEAGVLPRSLSVSEQGMLAVTNEDRERIEYHNFPIPDRCLPPSKSYLMQILSLIANETRRKRITAVHCRGGIGRTGTIIGCYLIQSGIASSGDAALQIISEQWKGVEKCRRYPCSPETGEQCEFVRKFRRVSWNSDWQDC